MALSQKKAGRYFFVAGGKTGGHLFPGISIAEAILAKDPSCQPVFLGVKNGLEAKIIPEKKFLLHFLSVEGFFGVAWWKKLYAVCLLPWAFVQALYYLLRYRPKFVLGVGGYASFPVLVMAVVLRIPTALQEQNVVLGKVNSLLLPWVGQVFMPARPPGFPPKYDRKLKLVGNPVRKEIHALSLIPLDQLNRTRSTQDFQILVLGGSQGARFINQQFISLAERLHHEIPNLKIVHQTGARNFSTVSAFYQQKPALQAESLAFIDAIDQVLIQTHLILARAGAGIYEFNAAGRVGIYIPIQHSSGGHQKENALLRAKNGAGWVLEEVSFQPENLIRTIVSFYQDVGLRAKMEEASRKMYLGDAASEIAKDLIRYIKN